MLWLLAAAGYLAAEAFAAMALPGYAYGGDFISTLGDPAVSSWAPLMNAAFAFQGVCFAVAAALVADKLPNPRVRRSLLVCAIGNGVGNVLIAVVHSGQGNPWHVIGAVLAIVGGNAAALAGSVATVLTSAWSPSKTSVLVVFGEPSGLRTEVCVTPVSGSVRRGAATE